MRSEQKEIRKNIWKMEEQVKEFKALTEHLVWLSIFSPLTLVSSLWLDSGK